MAKRLQQSLTDYMVIAISPALIMTMIGSLVFFLLAILYQGDHDGRLRMIFAFFILGTVMLGRLSIEEGKEYATLYALPLGGVTLMALMRFVRVSGPLAGLSLFVNLGIMSLVWWLAHKLTWDCTLIDDDVDASGEGLLEQFGLDRGEVVDGTNGSARGVLAADNEAAVPTASEGARVGATAEHARNWLRRFLRRRGGQQRPGLWVVYLSFAALPVFGFGQAMIPAANSDLRDPAFRFLYVYLASALGLLLTTSFLGLRRYLRQRRVEMPGEMAGMWLVAGTGMIVVLLGLCMMIPTRGSELPIIQVPLRLLSPDNLSTSDYAMLDEGQYEHDAQQAGDHNEQQANGGQQPSDGNAKGGETQDTSSQDGQKQSPDGKQSDQGGGESKTQGESSSSDKSQQGNESPSNSDEGSSQQKSSNGQPNKPDSQQQPSQQQDASQSTPSPNEHAADPSSQNAETQSPNSTPPEPKPSAPSKFQPRQLAAQLGRSLESIVRLIFYAALIGAIAYFLWKYRERVREAIAEFLRWLREMLGGKSASNQVSTATSADPVVRLRSFSEYPNPFRSGQAAKMAPGELVSYSFEALEAWAREQGCSRDAQQTPHEFVQMLVARQPVVATEVAELGTLYNRVAYAKATLRPDSIEIVRRIWTRWERLAPATVQS